MSSGRDDDDIGSGRPPRVSAGGGAASSRGDDLSDDAHSAAAADTGGGARAKEPVGMSGVLGMDIPEVVTRPSTRRSTTGQRSKFVLEDDIADEAMVEHDVVLNKEAYGEPGTNEYRKNFELATAALTERFGVASHKILSDSGRQSGDQADHRYVQQVIVNVLHRVEEAHQHSIRMDFMGICLLAKMAEDTTSNDCRDWWDDDSEMNIFTQWDRLTEKQVRGWQFSINKKFSDGDRTASRWLRAYIYNSSTDSLRAAVKKKYEKLANNQKGGVIYLYYTLCEMFKMSETVKSAIISFISLFKRKGLSRYEGENVLRASEEVLGVLRRLDAVGAVHVEYVSDVVKGLCVCNNTRFRDMFKHLKSGTDLGNKCILDGIEPDSTPMESIEVIFAKAIEKHDELCVANQWNPAVKGGGGGNKYAAAAGTAGAPKPKCWNCDQEGCSVGKCKKPKDQERIKKNKKAWEKKVKEFKSQGSRNSNTNTSNSNSRSSGNPGPGQYNRKHWDAVGLSWMNGCMHMKCKSCGWNTTHSTKYHEEWNRNKQGFTMPANSPFQTEKARLEAGGDYVNIPRAPQNPPGQPPPAAPPTQGAGTITYDRATIEARIDDIERNSDDPNASDFAELIRKTFLN